MTGVTRSDVLAAVASAWGARPERTVSWPDPHPDGGPLDEEYSRVTDPERYVVVGARALAWVDALVALGLATSDPRPDGSVRLTPSAPGALVLDVHVRAALEDLDGSPVAGTGVDLLVGDPSKAVAGAPACGCDACDDGSEHQLEMVDDAFEGVLGGGFVLIEDEDAATTDPDDPDGPDDGGVRIVATHRGWSASGDGSGAAEAIAAARRGERRPGQRTLVGATWWSV